MTEAAAAKAPSALETLKAKIEAADKAAELALAETRKAGAARIVIIKQMEEDKKLAMVRLKKQRTDALQLLTRINHHDAERKKQELLAQQLRAEYKEVAKKQAEQI